MLKCGNAEMGVRGAAAGRARKVAWLGLPGAGPGYSTVTRVPILTFWWTVGMAEDGPRMQPWEAR